jgi:hypothetical protein
MRLGRNVTAGIVAGALALAWGPAAWAQAKPAAKPGKPAAAAGGQAADAAPGAKPDLAAAKKHYGEGDKKFKAGDFAGALAEFKAANEIKSTPQAERYLGMCEDALGHFALAVEWYDKFLAHAPEKLKEQADEIKKRSGEIKALPGKVHIESAPPGASVTVDDKPQSAPTPLDVELVSGSHKIKVTAQGRLPAEKAIDVSFASSQTVSVSLDAEPAPPPPPPAPVAVAPPPSPQTAPPPPPPAEPRSKVPAYITGGLAVVAAGVGTAFGIIALNDKSSYDKNPTSSTADSGDTHALIADMAFGVAITFGVTSAVLFLTKDEPPAAAPAAGATGARHTAVKITPTPMVGPHSGGAGFVVQF